MTEKGYVYVLSNPSIPGALKVGMTNRCPRIRAEELYTTGVPEKFVVEYARYVDDPKGVERNMHECLSDRRISNNREFFNIPLDIAIWELEKYPGSVWKDDKEEELYIQRRRAINNVIDDNKREQLRALDDMTYKMEEKLKDEIDRLKNLLRKSTRQSGSPRPEITQDTEHSGAKVFNTNQFIFKEGERYGLD